VELLHPYTRMLLKSTNDEEVEPLASNGLAGSSAGGDHGCPCLPWCPLARRHGVSGRCAAARPCLQEIDDGHRVACHFLGEVEDQ
jgi:ABC-type dipeptide/oligopeptide/nickel transport system ATPase component